MSQQQIYMPLASPMLGSTLTSAPRLQGDGMDQEALLLQGAVPMETLPAKTPYRHANLNSTLGSTSVDKKRKSPRYVPHEPVKGAVKAVGPEEKAVGGKGVISLKGKPNSKPVSALSSVKRGSSPGESALNMPPETMAKSDVQQRKTFSAGVTNEQKVDSIKFVKSFQVPVYNAPSHLSLKTYETMKDFKKPQMTQGTSVVTKTWRENMSSKETSVSNSHIVAELKPEVGVSKPVDNTGGTERAESVPPPAEEEREVEGQARSHSEASRMEQQLKDMRQQLDVQTKINTDLKKLLVASMGDDLHYKVETLVRTKAQLATEIGDYTKKMYQDYENLDKLSIQADMWRSKFMASRVLVDQLAQDKDTLVDKCEGSQRALQQLMQERQQLREWLVETHRYLKLMKDSFDPKGVPKRPPIIPNLLELARTNLLVADSVKFRLLGSVPMFPAALDAGIQDGLTPAEKLAYQVLSEDETDPVTGSVVPSGRLSAHLLNKYSRFHPQVRYENVTFNCCKNCKGDVLVV